MANSILAKMAVEIYANVAGLNKGTAEASKKLKEFEKNIGDTAKILGAAFAGGVISNFTLEISKLAGEAEGVRAAFQKLPDSIALMARLKDATKGTVSELDLMKRAVMANNFGISLEALPKLLEFASVRAKQTGQSVDYLVDSIVTGIGRKSKLILDNLGISAVQLTEALGGASTAAASIEDVANAVGSIAEKELAKMGSMSENASTKIERLAASWTNLKVAIGESANNTGILSQGLNMLTKTFDVLSGDKLTKGINALLHDTTEGTKQLLEFSAVGGKIDLSWQELLAKGFVRTEEAAKRYEKILKSIASDAVTLKNNRAAAVDDSVSSILPAYKKLSEEIETISSLTEKLNLLNVDQATLTGAQLIATNKEIKSIEEKIKKLKELGVEKEKANKLIVADSEDARSGRIAKLERSLTPKKETGLLGASPDLNTNPDAINAMAAAYDNLGNSIKVLNEKQQQNNNTINKNAEAWINFGLAAGSSISAAIAADQDLGKSIANVTADIISSSAERISAYLGEGIAKAFSINPIAGVAIATVGIAAITGLLRKAGRSKNETTIGYSRPQMNSYSASGSQNSIQFVLRGQDIHGSLSNFQRNNRYTTAGG